MSNTIKKPEEEIVYNPDGTVVNTGVYPESVVNGTAAPATVSTGAESSAATPAATPTVPLNYEEFLKNQYDTSKQTAAAERARAEKAAETARQKQIIDAQNAYKTGLATYGANAEAAGSMGLTGSGYGEYLTGKAYATQRGEVASANRTAAALKEQAIYNEQNAISDANQIYAEEMLNLGEKQKQEAETAYTSLLGMAESGATLEQLTNSADWGRLSPEQQKTVSRAVSEKSLATRLSSGESLEALMLTEDWSALDDAGRTRLQNIATGLGEGNYATALDMINNGTAIADIKNLSLWKSLSEPEKNHLRGREAYWRGAEAIANGLYDAESITTLPGYEHMSEPDKASLNKQIAARDKEEHNNKLQELGTNLENVLSGYVTIADLNLGEYEAEFRDRLDKAIKTQILVYPDEAFNIIELNYANGNIDLPTRQAYQFELTKSLLNTAEFVPEGVLSETVSGIEKDRKAGIISDKQAEELRKIAVSGHSIAKTPYQLVVNITGDGKYAEFSANGKNYKYKIKSAGNIEASDILDAAAMDASGKIKNNTIGYINNALYIYRDGKWYRLKNKSEDDEADYAKILYNETKGITTSDTTARGAFYNAFSSNSSNTGNTKSYGPQP